MFNLSPIRSLALMITLLTGGVMLALVVNGYVESEFLPALLFPMVVYMVVIGGVDVARRVMMMRNPASIQLTDITAEERNYPGELVGTVRELERIGFRRMGELVLQYPLDDDRRILWLFFHQERPVIAEVIHDTVTTIIYSTVLSDRAVVETLTPNGEEIRDSDYWQTAYRADPVVTFNYHWNNLLKYRDADQMPVAIRSMDVFIRWRRFYDETYRPRLMNTSMIINSVVLLCAIIFLIVFSINIYTDLRDITLSLSRRFSVDLLFFGAAFIYVFTLWLAGRRRVVR